ncbi:MAG: phosphate ABC transporter permease PstA [Thermoproteota archaeon]|nr:phosphate ABC transporter permease PstA [Thermoproteota archaeon]
MSSKERKDYRPILHEQMKKIYRTRIIIDKLATIFAIVCVVAAIIPLGSILLEVVKNGASALSLEFLVAPQGSIGSGKGGIGPAIQGTMIVVGLASLIATPAGVLAGIYLSEFAGNGIFPSAVRFLNSVLTGLPSIVIGIVGYVTVVLVLGSFSVWAGALSLSIIMIPIVVIVTEETLRIVPHSLREAGYALGISKAKITLNIVLMTAKSGVLTGIGLGIARIAGETAPLIMTLLGTSLFFSSLEGPVDALPLRIWRLASQPYESAHSFGWGAALVLILMVLGMNLGLRLLARKKGFTVRAEV